jgi:hypothetical protein
MDLAVTHLMELHSCWCLFFNPQDLPHLMQEEAEAVSDFLALTPRHLQVSEHCLAQNDIPLRVMAML